MRKHQYCIHPIDYSKGYGKSAAFQEWLYWIIAMAPYDVGIYD